MKSLTMALIGLTFTASITIAAPAAAPNGMTPPVGWQNWRLIAVSQRTENNTLRAILGNSIAVDAARAGKTNPWPDGAVLAKLNWKQKTSETFPTAIVPDEFVHVDFMAKDSQKFAATGGWGFSRWLGLEQKAYDKADVAQECLGCHGMMKAQDYVFTHPAKLPQ